MTRLWLLVLMLPIVAGCSTPSGKSAASVPLLPCPFHAVALPKVEGLLGQDPRLIAIEVDTNGRPSISRTSLSLPLLRSMVLKVRSDNTEQTSEFCIGADGTTPFDSVWPILDILSESGIPTASLAVTKGDQQCMNLLRFKQAHYSPKGSEELIGFSLIRVTARGFVVGELKSGTIRNQQFIASADAGELLWHQYLKHQIWHKGIEQPIVVVPSSDASYRQVAEALYFCHFANYENLILVHEDNVPVLDPNPQPFKTAEM
jgi:biopolymer transport protein ExbD